MIRKTNSQFSIENNSEYSALENLFAEIVTKRTEAGITKHGAYCYLKGTWKLSGNVDSCREPINFLESLYHLERIILRPLYRAARSVSTNKKFDNLVET